MKVVVIIAWIISGYAIVMLLFTRAGRDILLNTMSLVTDVINDKFSDPEDRIAFVITMVVSIILLGLIVLSIYGILNWSSL